jgi:drug/metabolite transporter (DMT)-like permease
MVDLFLYFKALSLGDISIISALISLTSVSSIVGSYFILDQRPTVIAVVGAVLILQVHIWLQKKVKVTSTLLITDQP